MTNRTIAGEESRRRRRRTCISRLSALACAVAATGCPPTGDVREPDPSGVAAECATNADCVDLHGEGWICGRGPVSDLPSCAQGPIDLRTGIGGEPPDEGGISPP